MNTKLQGRRRFYKSVGHAIDGINYVTVKEKNFKIEIVIGIITIILGFLLKVSRIEWLILIITIALVLCFEIINTSIERAVDLITKEYQDLAKITKDASAAAVLVMSMFAIVIGIIIFLPKIANIFNIIK
jgi:undecaprenol kinase